MDTGKKETKIEQCVIPISFTEKFQPEAARLSGLGFSSVAVSDAKITIRKNSSSDIFGRPHLFIEIEISKDKALVSYSVPLESDPACRQLQAAALFLRVLALLPGASISAGGSASVLLPPIETAARIAGTNYQGISKKYSEARSEAADLATKNSALQKSSEENALATIELQRQLSALSSRIKELESVTDPTLCEMVFDWISSHRGSFDAAQFSKANGVPPSRAEEGLDLLLCSGAIEPIGGGYAGRKPPSRGLFQSKSSQGLLSASSGALKKLLKR
jgi:hypothetical protein